MLDCEVSSSASVSTSSKRSAHAMRVFNAKTGVCICPTLLPFIFPSMPQLLTGGGIRLGNCIEMCFGKGTEFPHMAAQLTDAV